MKKVLALLLVMTFMLSVPIAASSSIAKEDERVINQTKNIATGRFTVTLEITDYGKAIVTGKVNGSGLVDSSAVYCFLKKKVNGNWVNVSVFSKQSDIPIALATGEIYVDDGYYYKVVAYSYVYDVDGKLIESLSEETNAMWY